MKNTEEFRRNFLTDTDDTGRFVIKSQRTGRTYFVEPIGADRPADWGSINPATGDMMVKKGWGKNRGSIDKDESLITKENGFDEIHLIGPGSSPQSKVQELDAQYPDKPFLRHELDIEFVQSHGGISQENENEGD